MSGPVAASVRSPLTARQRMLCRSWGPTIASVSFSQLYICDGSTYAIKSWSDTPETYHWELQGFKAAS